MATHIEPSNRWQFSEDEIRAKLEELGYNNIPDKALKEFSKDLHVLISTENSKGVHHRDSISSTSSALSSPALTTSDQSIHRRNVNKQHSIPDETDTWTSYSDDQSSFQESPVIQNHRSHTYAYAEKENQSDGKNPKSLRVMQKRKVLRKKNGEAHVFDESFSQDNATDISDVERRLQKLPLKDNAIDSESIDDDDDNMSEPSSVLQPWGRNRNVLPSFIRPRTADPHSKGIRKTDPVSRYHQFKKEWLSNKVPGEKMHKSLRWSTREQMLQYDSFEKPRHSYVPNNYVAPTQKKRQSLRWEVRSTLANS